MPHTSKPPQTLDRAVFGVEFRLRLAASGAPRPWRPRPAIDEAASREEMLLTQVEIRL